MASEARVRPVPIQPRPPTDGEHRLLEFLLAGSPGSGELQGQAARASNRWVEVTLHVVSGRPSELEVWDWRKDPESEAGGREIELPAVDGPVRET